MTGAWADYVLPSARPRVVPLFGPRPGWEPDRECPHRGPLPKHTQMICMVCHATGDVAERMAARHGEPIDSRPDPNYPAAGTTYEPDAKLKGGKG